MWRIRTYIRIHLAVLNTHQTNAYLYHIVLSLFIFLFLSDPLSLSLSSLSPLTSTRCQIFLWLFPIVGPRWGSGPKPLRFRGKASVPTLLNQNGCGVMMMIMSGHSPASSLGTRPLSKSPRPNA